MEKKKIDNIQLMYENIIEITWIYDQLHSDGKLIPIDQVYDCSRGVRDTIITLAQQFEQEYPADQWEDGDKDYIIEIEKYTTRRLVEIYGTPEAKKQMAEELWQSLEDVPIDNNDKIQESWNQFPEDTSKYDIWSWFEEAFNVSVAIDLMHLEEGF